VTKTHHAPLEVHSHCFVSTRRAFGCYGKDGKWDTGTFSHSHAGGNVPHEHPHTGPAFYTIDKDDWYRSTGLRGGGRKKFTAKPSGEQFPIVALEPWQTTFELIIGTPTPRKGEPGYAGEGPGIALPLRLIKSFGMTCIVKDGTKGGGR